MATTSVPASHASSCKTTVDDHANTPTSLCRKLLHLAIIDLEDWDQVPEATRSRIENEASEMAQLEMLAAAGLVTAYQYQRIRAGRLHGLVLGNYRILERLGTGPSGVVYRGEHRRLKQSVAIKILHHLADASPATLGQIFHNIRAVSRLHHPAILPVIDAGEEVFNSSHTRPVPFLVTEYIPGHNLATAIEQSPLPLSAACHLAHQLADSLDEAHRQGLIHGNIKPSNIWLTREGHLKLLDFGLSQDAARGDHRVDIRGLGETILFALTGQSLTTDISDPQTISTLKIWLQSQNVPPSFENVLTRMLARDPQDRFPTMEAFMRALLPYLPTMPRPSGLISVPGSSSVSLDVTPAPSLTSSSVRVLIVDDQAEIRRLCRIAMMAEGYICDEAGTGPDAVALVSKEAYDLILLDVDLPGFSGEEVLRRIRQSPQSPHQKVLMFSGNASGDELSRNLNAGADDFLTKPFSLVQLRARAKAALRLKEAQDRSDMLNHRLLTLNAELEQNLCARDSELLRARNALVLALAKLVEHRSAETGPHLMRLQRYCRVLAECAGEEPAFRNIIDTHFVELLEDCAPLHDIGKAALPDHVLNKPGALDNNERILMQAHTTIGAQTLREVAQQYPFATGFLQMAIDIARSHHERWDGTGYPDRLSGEAIPLAARLVAIADVYDALRSQRIYKPALSHTSTVLTMTESSAGHFDPALMQVFHRCAEQFDKIFREFSG